MLATIHAHVTGRAVVLAVLAVVVVAVLDRVLTIKPSWWVIATLFGVALLTFALLFTYS